MKEKLEELNLNLNQPNGVKYSIEEREEAAQRILARLPEIRKVSSALSARTKAQRGNNNANNA